MKKVSVIIPMFNCQDTIEQTLASVQRQTLQEIEIIVVDDASADDSVQLVRRVAATDDRIVLLTHEQGQGCAMARKTGVEQAAGEYILFVDGDDEIKPETCEALYAEAKKDDVDILHYGVRTVAVRTGDAQIEKNTDRFLAPYLEDVEPGAVFDHCFVDRDFNWNLVNKFIKADLCKKAFAYVEPMGIQRGEDLYIFSMIAFFAQTYRGLDNAVFYTYYFGNGQDGNALISLENVEALANSRLAVQQVQKFLAAHDAPEEYVEAIDAIERTLLANCAYQCKVALPPELLSEAFYMLCEKWGSEKAIVAFANQYWADPRPLADALEAPFVELYRDKEIRRIATYYHACTGGGAEGVLLHLTDLWTADGYEVTILVDSLPEEMPSLPDGVEIVLLPTALKRNANDYYERAAALAELIVEHQIDALVYHGWLNKCLLWDMLITKSCGAAFFVHCHGIFSHFLNDINRSFSDMGLVYSLADAVVSLGETDSMYWKQFNRNVFVTKNPLPISPDDVTPAPLTNKNVLWLGRFSPEKQPEEAVEVFNLVHRQDPEITFTMVGDAIDPNYRKKILTLIEDAGLADVVETPGWENGEKKIQRYLNTRVFLMTSSAKEGSPLTLAESKACGVPCVMYDLPYLDFVRDGRGIITVPFRRAALAASHIVQLCQDDDLVRELGRAARESALDIHAYDRMGFWRTIFTHRADENVGYVGELRPMIDTLASTYRFGVETIDLPSMRRNARWLNKHYKKEHVKLLAAQKQIKQYKKSSSWRIGRAVTKLPRAIKRIIRKR